LRIVINNPIVFGPLETPDYSETNIFMFSRLRENTTFLLISCELHISAGFPVQRLAYLVILLPFTNSGDLLSLNPSFYSII